MPSILTAEEHGKVAWGLEAIRQQWKEAVFRRKEVLGVR